MFNLLQKYSVEVFGTLAGAFSGVIGMKTGSFCVPDDIHAIALAFITGAAGGLGALVVKAVYKKIKPKI